MSEYRFESAVWNLNSRTPCLVYLIAGHNQNKRKTWMFGDWEKQFLGVC